MRLIDADEFFKDFAELEPYEHISHEYDIDAEPVRQGHWIKVGCSFYGVSRYECSVCHYTDEHNESREVPYCWQCGARMEEEEVEE